MKRDWTKVRCSGISIYVARLAYNAWACVAIPVETARLVLGADNTISFCKNDESFITARN